MNDETLKQRRALEAQVERWTAEAKKLAEAGKETAALELYQKASDELPGAPWLQHRTAEVARKLKRFDVALIYFRRAATAFQIANFPKRAVAPLRMAWSIAEDGLPGSSKMLVDVALELMQVQRGLGFTADATVTLERTNAALKSRGFSEISPQALEAVARGVAAARASERPPSSAPPSSRSTPTARSPLPPSDVAPRRPSPAPEDDATKARSRALARLFGRAPR